jgi:hypothetical protein
VEIRRYSEPVAYIESVDQHREHQELDAALNRAIWALDLARAMGDVNEGNFERWEKGGRNSARQIPQALGATPRPVILGRESSQRQPRRRAHHQSS